jgi:hypothetical protein
MCPQPATGHLKFHLTRTHAAYQVTTTHADAHMDIPQVRDIRYGMCKWLLAALVNGPSFSYGAGTCESDIVCLLLYRFLLLQVRAKHFTFEPLAA